MATLFEEETDVLDEITITDLYDLVVFNDEVNTFDHVIATLMEVCKHTPEQAEQCTLIIHYKGKCTVKCGSFDELAPMRNAICGRGISAEVL
ncbi:MAG: ATP-dependent Clp protease adaptor ClpS [Cytophagales bacterium]|nr:ATP-dependent Clp protease adaptor ClpS [Cytophagales bacterium]